MPAAGAFRPDCLRAGRGSQGVQHRAIRILSAASDIHAGMREFEIATLLRGRVAAANQGARCDGFAYCMSGPNSARAYAAFQQSTSRAIVRGDSVLLHCNSCCEGLWTDITRTFSVGSPDTERRAIN